MRYIALIPAAGVGERFGAGKPKQYVEIAGQTVLQHTLSLFARHPRIDAVAVVLSPDDLFFEREIQTALPEAAEWHILRVGGESRAQSVKNGLQALLEQGLAAENDQILVHDAARCCLPQDALSRLLDASEEGRTTAILAVPVADTLKRGRNGQIAETVSREHLWQAQTPQMSPAGQLWRALCAADLNTVTDEASALEAAGVSVHLVAGDSRNLKLTQPQDEYIVRLLLAQP